MIPLPFGFSKHEIEVKEIVTSEIRRPDETARFARYQNLLFLFLCTVILLELIYFFTLRNKDADGYLRNKGPRLILKLALFGTIVIASIKLLLLPINFGKLIVSNEYPVVLVTVDDEQLDKEIKSDQLFLMLLKNKNEIVLYDPDNPIWESIVTLQREKVSSIRVVGTDKAL